MAYYLFKNTLPSRYLSKCCLSNKSSSVSKLLSTIIVDMHTLVTYFRIILEICIHFAGNHVNEKGDIPRRGAVPTLSDLEVITLSQRSHDILENETI